ncbi:aldo/keto reductase [Pendulispora albinea]|uniref:Aldo/keto reductase n=1 Tax=Pendulispora albinea TaxID=2741071 RepID=A0ABZ2LXZ0_9BACT
MNQDVSTATLNLRSGGAIPQIGLGVWQMSPHVTRGAVLNALHAGYRHIDTARIYGNEAEVGAAVRESGIPREEIFVTTKLWNEDQGYESARRAFDTSLRKLGLDYVDLYLIHWPVKEKRRESWRALEKIHADGLARSIGVSNFLVNHLEELLGDAKERPEVNQIEIHPFLQQRDTRALCAKYGIVVEAYSPLVRGKRHDNPVLRRAAKRVGKTPAQVLLRWGIQHGLVIIPKSADPGRQKQNAELFDFSLDAEAMSAIDALEQGQATGWDPRDQP